MTEQTENNQLRANQKFLVHAVNELKQNLENAISRAATLSVQIQDLTEARDRLQSELTSLKDASKVVE